ncbi:hypothetical protein [Proteus phage PM2]|uniref:Uncharacterized protein n=1 Tax=Proteus phage PM2 TaxID=2025809 RepID=A0A249XWM7_9CAUD|nr:hypothetical protein KNT71_gp239 [Proteus phage PM2]ASZ76393.1 hypothetical protein [Proteus phage PM2]
MNYYDKIDEVVSNFVHPCEGEVPDGFYRRVKWELYNPSKENKGPGNGEEWDTEIIKIGTRLYDANPFGHKSEEFPEPSVEGEDEEKCKFWSKKIGICFKSQQELTDYVESIGSKLLPGNDWYGADLSKSNLFKTPHEYKMYQIENAGGTWSKTGPSIDKRTMLMVDKDYNISINYNGVYDSRSAYLKHYEDKPCTYVGIRLNLDVDLSVPGIPESEPPKIGDLPAELPSLIFAARSLPAIGCIPFKAKFPYNGLSQAIVEAWNESRRSFKLMWADIPGLPEGEGSIWSTMYSGVSIAMEELGNASLSMCQYVQQMAWLTFKEVISQALNIVGAGWDLLKSFIPKVTILGITFDIEDICTSGNGLQKLKEAFSKFDIEKVIEGIYAFIGSAYEYSVEYVKVFSRDLIDALTDLYDYLWYVLMTAGVALCKTLVNLAEIWSIPPWIPNPLWNVVIAVKELMKQIEPLDMILKGGFPGFTASDLYYMVERKVKELIDEAYTKIESLKNQAIKLWEQVKEAKDKWQKESIGFKQYLKGMYGAVSEELTRQKEALVQEAKDIYENLLAKYEALNINIDTLKTSVSNVLELALNELRNLPIVDQIEQLLSLVGTSFDEMITTIKNSITGAQSLYKNFTDGSRSLKDICKYIFSQISTLSLSKVTQWINKLLSIFGLEIKFPELELCIPYVKYEE